METLAKLKEILSECKGEELDVNMDTTFDELDFDSLRRKSRPIPSSRT